jgi:type II secretion system protein J
MRTATTRQPVGFTLIEVLIAIGILSLVIASIYSTWTAILRASKSGQTAAAAVQRTRIVVRLLEDSLSSAQCFGANVGYYGFIAENGDEASLSFVARLSRSFPRSGRFGDLDVRRVTFAVQPGSGGGRNLVLRQTPLVMDTDEDETEHPIVLAKNVKEFSMEFWDNRLNDWVDEWKQTNQLPRLITFNLRFADTAQPLSPVEEISRVISIPSVTVQPVWQVPRMPGAGAIPPGGGTNQPGVLPPGTTPGIVRPGG